MSKKNESSLGRARLRCPGLYRSFPKQESSNDELGITRVWQIIEDQESLTMDELIDEVRINILKPDGTEYSSGYRKGIIGMFNRFGLIEVIDGVVALPSSLSGITIDALTDDTELSSQVLACILNKWGSDNAGNQYLLEMLMDIWSILPADTNSSLKRGEITTNLRKRGWDTSYSANVWNRALETSLSLMLQIGMINRELVGRSPRYSRVSKGTGIYQRMKMRSVLAEFENAIDRLGPNHDAWTPNSNFSRDPLRHGCFYAAYRFNGGFSKRNTIPKKLRTQFNYLYSKVLNEFFLKDLNKFREQGYLSKPPQSEKPTTLRTLLQAYQGIYRDAITTKFSLSEETDAHRLLHNNPKKLTVKIMETILEDCHTVEDVENAILAATAGRVNRLLIDKIAENHTGQPGQMVSQSPPHPATEWQKEAVKDWLSNDHGRGPEGIVAAVTGSGKTVMAIRAVSDYFVANPDAIASVVVPTRVLMSQWGKEFAKFLGYGSDIVGYRGDNEKDSFEEGKRIIIWVINSASQDDELHQQIAANDCPHLLIADECHGYGGVEYNKVFQDDRMPDGKKLCSARLGLSATPPERETELELVDDDEEDSQIEGSGAILDALGECICEMTYADALAKDLISPFEIRYLGIPLKFHEDDQYDRLTKQINEARDKIYMDWPELERFSNAPLIQQLNRHAKKEPAINLDSNVKSYRILTKDRLNVLALACNRKAAATGLIKLHLDDNPDTRFIVFHQQISQLEDIFAPNDGRHIAPGVKLGDVELGINKNLEDMWHRGYGSPKQFITPSMYHSKLGDAWKNRSMELFRSGASNAMLAVRALDEGLDVPDANVGIVRVSGSSTRRLIQRIGRMLRRKDDKKAVIWIFYVTREDGRATGDCGVLKDPDWHEQLGTKEIRYLRYDSEVEGDFGYGPNIVEMPIDEVPFREASPFMSMPIIVPEDELNVGEPYPGRPVGDEYRFDAQGRIVISTKVGKTRVSDPSLESITTELGKATEGRGATVKVSPQGHVSVWVHDKQDRIYLGTISKAEVKKIVSDARAAKTDSIQMRGKTKGRPSLAEILANNRKSEE